MLSGFWSSAPDLTPPMRVAIVCGCLFGVGVLLCFLVLAFVHHCLWVVGGGAFWVGHKCLMQMSTLSGSRSTPCWRPPLLWWLPA